MIDGNVDLLTLSTIRGWAFEKKEPNKRLHIQIFQNNNLIAETLANIFREDLKKIIPSGNISFEVNFIDTLQSLENVKVVVKKDNGEIFELPVKGKIISKRYGYQTFSDQIGDSLSSEKLKCLRLPASFENMSVLDIGCNEGFFCIDAVKRGATRVVGIDKDQSVINKARKRTKDVEYICTDWWHLPDEKFDIIYFLSAIHYENNQDALILYIKNHLKDDGLFILECGVYQSSQPIYGLYERNDGCFRYPTFITLTSILKKYFHSQCVNKSVLQKGDDIPRFVFHCKNKQPVAILIGGESGVGKSTITQMLSGKELFNIDTDSIFHLIKDRKFTSLKHNIIKKIYNECDPTYGIGIFYNSLSESEKKELLTMICEIIPTEFELVLLNGYIFTDEYSIQTMTDLLYSLNFRVWILYRNR